MKKVVAACIDQLLLFDSEKEFQLYEEGLKRKKAEYKICQVDVIEKGQCLVRVKRQYNSTTFMG